METLEQSQRRLDAFDELGGIVRTMKALAGASIRQYERAVESLAVYSRTVELGLYVALQEGTLSGTSAPPETGPVAAVVFGSDHGLCGRFNEDLAEHAQRRLVALGLPSPPRVLAVGSRVGALLESAGVAVEETMLTPSAAGRITATVREIVLRVDAWHSATENLRLYLLHNRPLSGHRYDPTASQLLPVDLPRLRRLDGERWPSKRLPTFSMDREQLLSALLGQYFFVSIFRACAESLAAENASRLAAMLAAERNLTEQRDRLLSEFRRRRQEAITAELLDVVTGYEALRTRDLPRDEAQP
jgi:F-type H+-transporting ATPase subunit gamma